MKEKNLYKKLSHNPVVCLMVLCLVLGVYYCLQPSHEEGVTVVSVIDGDTVDVLLEGERQRVRLAYIDAPEMEQPYGKEAKQALASLLKDKTITIQVLDKDKYQRSVAIIKAGKSNVNQEMVRLGMALVYSDYNDDLMLLPIEAQARMGKVGLWKQSEVVAPWIYRRSNGHKFEGKH